MTDAERSSNTGFAEVEHTADWAFQLWGPNLEDLFIQGAIALNTLADLDCATGPEQIREIELRGIDAESLLVAWLNELLYLQESENFGCSHFEMLQLEPQYLRARVRGTPILHRSKHIKAVTYNNLSIQPTERGVEATVVLDV